MCQSDGLKGAAHWARPHPNYDRPKINHQVGLPTYARVVTARVMSTPDESAALRAKAAKCRRLANGMADDETIAALRRLAESYDGQADLIERASAPGESPRPAE